MLVDDVTEKTLVELKLSMDEVLHLWYVAKKCDLAPILTTCKQFIQNKQWTNIVLVHETLRTMNEEELELSTFNLMVE